MLLSAPGYHSRSAHAESFVVSFQNNLYTNKAESHVGIYTKTRIPRTENLTERPVSRKEGGLVIG